MPDRVAKLRALLREASESPAPSPEQEARRAYQRYASNEERVFFVDPAPRAKSIREILRIATTYHWPHEVERALDAAGAMCLTSLNDDDLDALLRRLRQLEDCARNGWDSPDAPVAR